MLTIDPDILARMKSPCVTPSLAATFPPRQHQPRSAPMPERMTRTARCLAHRGAMEPEGCTREELMRAKRLYRVPTPAIEEILRTLWAFRLLGYGPADTLGITYEQITELV